MFVDPEVHIGLENLQHFPAFGSPPLHIPPGQNPEFFLGPPSPLSSSPASGNAVIPVNVVNCNEADVSPQGGTVNGSRVKILERIIDPALSPFRVSDVAMFPSLNGSSPSVSVGSVEEDSPCMSFAQV